MRVRPRERRIPGVVFVYNLKNEKIHFFSCEIDHTGFFDQNSALQAACDTWIAGGMGCVYPPEGCYRSVTPLLLPGSTGLTRSALFCARKLYNPH